MGPFALFALAALAGCSAQDDADPPAENTSAANVVEVASASFAGTGRDRLCLSEADGRSGFVTYGSGDANCSVSGTVQRSGTRLTIMPEGDTTCRIEATLAGDRVTLESAGESCAYYCGPSASFAGKSFTRTPTPQPVTDLAGDPLC